MGEEGNGKSCKTISGLANGGLADYFTQGHEGTVLIAAFTKNLCNPSIRQSVIR